MRHARGALPHRRRNFDEALGATMQAQRIVDGTSRWKDRALQRAERMFSARSEGGGGGGGGGGEGVGDGSSCDSGRSVRSNSGSSPATRLRAAVKGGSLAASFCGGSGRGGSFSSDAGASSSARSPCKAKCPQAVQHLRSAGAVGRLAAGSMRPKPKSPAGDAGE